jgi:3',5'-cyclic AMP phosphodiesterase CpdA
MTITRRAFLGGMIGSLVTACAYRKITLPIFNSQKSSTRIAFITDLHLQSDILKQSVIEQTCTQAIKAINDSAVDLIIGGGDLIHRGSFLSYQDAQGEFKKFNQFWQELPAKKVLVPGNHDFTRAEPKLTPSLELFYQEVGSALPGNSEIDLGGAVLFSFNTISFVPGKEYEYSGAVTTDTLIWLKERFASYPADTVKILLTHMPLSTSLGFRNDQGLQNNWTVVNAREVFEIIGGHTTILLQGHLHINEFIRFNNSYSIIGGALSGKWWDGSSHGTQRGFGVLTIDGSNAEWDYINL